MLSVECFVIIVLFFVLMIYIDNNNVHFNLLQDVFFYWTPLKS